MTFSSATNLRRIRVLSVLAAAALLIAGSIALDAQRRGGGVGRGRVNAGAATTSVRSNNMVNRNVNANRDINRNVDRNVDRNVNRNVNRDIDRDIDFDRDLDVDVHYDRWGHPVARGVAVGVGVAAAVAVGTRVAVLPSSGCTTVVVGGIAYSECGSTWYQPYYSGTTVEYVVVNDPH